MNKLSKEPYKGTRDFYPEDMRLQNYIFNTMRTAVEKFGYEEYAASVMEESLLYRAKTGEEIVNEQTYSFTDRGGRDVTLRPEMTPTVARMVANKRKEISFPARWYSIPSCFRYERPQRGRLREFWQLNVDLLGDKSSYADAEIIQIAYETMLAFGAKPESFVIKVNNRKLMNELFAGVLSLDADDSYKLSKLIDRKNKISADEFAAEARKIAADGFPLLNQFLGAKTIGDLPDCFDGSENTKALREVMDVLLGLSIKNCVFDPTLMRGFDYYTGIVFEVFDTNPVNARSLFGGGRYDNLADLFEVESVPAVGFGMGDVTMKDYLETYGLTPALRAGIDLVVCVVGESAAPKSMELATELRKSGFAAVVDYSNKKIGQKIKRAEKDGAVFVVCVGDDEIKTDSYTLKKLSDYSEVKLSERELVARFSRIKN